MRLTLWRLLQYRALQQSWRVTAYEGLLPQVARTPRSRQRHFSIKVARQDSPFAESFFPTQNDPEPEKDKLLAEGENEILARARAYNIQNLDQLAFESGSKVSGRNTQFARLVDRSPHMTDFYLWSILLDYQKLKFGDSGVRRIWKALKTRGIFDLPYVGYQGDRLWSAFVSVGTRYTDFLTEVIRHERRHGNKRPRFFLEVVGALLNSEASHFAKPFARDLQGGHPPEKEEVYDLFVLATASSNPKALQIFCQVYGALLPLGLYSRIVSYLCTKERFSDAWWMHKFLLSHDDLPRTLEDIQHLILDLVKNHMRLEPLLHQLAQAGVSMEAQAKSFYSQERSLQLGFASENLNIVASNTLGVRVRIMSDEFAARAFMTATFGFDSILTGLRFFGLRMVGPSSIRAIGLTSANAQELTARFKKLAANEIDTGSSRFSRLVQKLAEDGKEKILKDVLHSDQHADVFEDLRLQRRLLLRYYKDGNWVSVERTIAVLTTGGDSNESVKNGNALNLMLQAALTARKWEHVQDIMKEMKSGYHKFTEASIARMYTAILSKREPSCLPSVRGFFDDLGYLISLWLKVLQSGSTIHVSRWREVLRRLGMCGRLDELEILLYQLLHFYGAGNPSKATTNAAETGGSFDQLLSPQLQSALVEWGFIHSRHLRRPGLQTPTGGLRRQPWGLRGILLLRNLKNKHHCNIDAEIVRKACLVRLRQLFNHRTESILAGNRRVRNRNRLSLLRYMDALNTAWTEPLFTDKQEVLQAVTSQAPITSRHRRRVAIRKEFGRHEPQRDSTAIKALATADIRSGQDKHGSLPSGVVIYGGPLSQAYWSQNNGKSRP